MNGWTDDDDDDDDNGQMVVAVLVMVAVVEVERLVACDATGGMHCQSCCSQQACATHNPAQLHQPEPLRAMVPHVQPQTVLPTRLPRAAEGEKAVRDEES